MNKKIFLSLVFLVQLNAHATPQVCQGIDGTYPMTIKSQTGMFSHTYMITVQKNGEKVSVRNTRHKDTVYTLTSRLNVIESKDFVHDCTSDDREVCYDIAKGIVYDVQYAVTHLVPGTGKISAEAISCVSDLATQTGIFAVSRTLESRNAAIQTLLGKD